MSAPFFADPEFDEFLYASVGEEDNGMQLSVLSALARQNVDAWEVARQLAVLPRDAAIRLLASMMAMVPAGRKARASPEEIAARLVALLPIGVNRARAAEAIRTQPLSPPTSGVPGRWRLVVAITLFLLASHWLIAAWTEGTPGEKPAPAHTGNANAGNQAPGG